MELSLFRKPIQMESLVSFSFCSPSTNLSADLRIERLPRDFILYLPGAPTAGQVQGATSNLPVVGARSIILP